MNYQIIVDEQKIRDFIDWLPQLTPEEKYYCCLFARSKYTKDENGKNGIAHIKSDKAQLKRFVSDKERLFVKIKQLEIEVGTYMQRTVPIPQEALALYITPNPRNMMKATVNTMVKLAQSIRDNNTCMNPHQEALSEIQKAKSRTCYVDFDIDFDEKDGDPEVHLDNIKEQILNYVNQDAVTLLRTRGGLHLLVEPQKVELRFKKSFYQNLSALGGVDQTGDQLVPIPGTYQGGFTPYFICF